MKLRQLPFVDQLTTDPDQVAARARRDNAMLELARCPGFQLILSALHFEQADALEALRSGAPRPDLHSGRAAAITNVINRVAALFPDGSTPDLEPVEEFDMPVYDDRVAFDIPYPTSGE